MTPNQKLIAAREETNHTKKIPNALNQQATMTNRLTITTMPRNLLLQHAEKKIKQKPTATTTKRHPLLTTKPKQHTKPKRYTLLAKPMVGINSPTMAKENMTLNRH